MTLHEELPMPVNTARVEGRRQVDYKSLEELLDDAGRLSSGNVKTLGNWSAGQIFQHLANAFHGSIDGFGAVFPWYIRWTARLFKKRLLAGTVPAGVKLPAEMAKKVMAEPVAADQGLANLRAAVARFQREPHRASHPVFGEITNEEWAQLHLKHANLHMSFLVPQ
jgi:Protein of unknown function (DUF1569)